MTNYPAFLADSVLGPDWYANVDGVRTLLPTDGTVGLWDTHIERRTIYDSTAAPASNHFLPDAVYPPAIDGAQVGNDECVLYTFLYLCSMWNLLFFDEFDMVSPAVATVSDMSGSLRVQRQGVA